LSFSIFRGRQKEMEITKELLVVAFIKSGQILGPCFLFYTFAGMFFHHGQFVWVEPNMAILIFEILLSASWVAGSFIDFVQTIAFMKEKKK
jgi:hypothetical protein